MTMPDARKLEGAISGRALYDGRIDPAEALAILRRRLLPEIRVILLESRGRVAELTAAKIAASFPCLDVKDGRVVKGVNFVDLIDAGDPVEAAKAYDAAGADELCFLDITASSDNRETIFDVVARTAEQCFMPLTVGGGVRQVADIRKLLLAGADKVSINTAAVKNPDFVAEAADKFGNQCIVVAIDAKKVSGAGEADRWEIFTHGGRREDRHRRGRVRAESRRPRRRRDPADLDGPRRHQGRLRHRADPRRGRRGARAGDRVAAASARSTTWSKASATAMRRRCLPPRSSISAPIRLRKPRRIWRKPAWPCGSTPSPDRLPRR